MEDKQVLIQAFKNAKFSKNELEKVLASFELVHFKKGENILLEGKTAKEYYYVNDGFLRSYVTDYKGNDITTGFYSKGKIILDMTSFFLKRPSDETIETLTNCTCWKITFDRSQYLFHHYESYREAGRARLVGAYFNLKKRSIGIITKTAKERYIELLQDQPIIIQQAPLKQIASYLGVTDTSLSRIRKEITL